MAAQARARWQRSTGHFGLVLLFAMGSSGNPVLAQGANGDGIYYTNRSTFQIPFQADAADRRIQQVLLHVSEDFGKTYQNVAAAGPNDRNFRFSARRDGWYWFTVQTVDADNRHSPANVNLAQPGLKVCVDTQAPGVTVRQAQLRDFPAGVEWDLRDENLDLMTLRVDYRVAGGRDWYPLPVQQLAQGSHGWNPLANAQLEVRVQVRDKAGNQGEGTGTVNPGPARPGAQPGPAAPLEQGRGTVMMVNKRKIQLNFKIEDEGPSGVASVEIWYTTDQRNWQRYKAETNKNPPYFVEVAGEGRYGFTLIARSGVGLSEPAPGPGDAPQIWVEVDETKPVVRLVGVEVGRGADSGNLTIRWTASDRYLTPTPVTISYAANPEGPWTTIAQNLPNDGRYVWRMGEGVPYQFHVRVEAVDRAGNLGRDETRLPVKVDLALPKARVFAVEAAPAKTNPDAPPPSVPDAPAAKPNAGASPPPPPTIPPAGPR